MTTAYLATEQTITLFHNDKVFTISTQHPDAPTVLEAIQNENYDLAAETALLATTLLNYVDGDLSIQNDEVYYKGTTLHPALTERLIAMKRQKFPLGPMLAFLENLFLNPSARAVDQLYQFLEKSDLPITTDGYFLGYKRINADYTDCYTGTIDNHPGTTVSVPRYKVDDDPTNTCSFGLHIASLDYLANYHGDRLVICKIHPKDVVSVPTDYDATKMRVCEYTVLQEIPMPDHFESLRGTWNAVAYDDRSDDDDDVSDETPF